MTKTIIAAMIRAPIIAPITIPAMAPPLREEPEPEPESPGGDEEVESESFDDMVTMFSSAPSTQVHADTLKVSRS